MIKIPIKEGENIERALKKFKRKAERTGIIKEVRARKAYIKPSVAKRAQMIKAKYVENMKLEEREG